MDWRERLAAYLRARLPSADRVDVGRVSAMPSGASNDTVALDLVVECDGVSMTLPLVLRPERRDGILAPYDVGRQFAVMRALAGTAVPAPTVLWYEPDAAAIGAPFYLMERVRGETLPLFWYGSQTPRLAAAARALATIHAVDWRAAGLSFLLPEGAGGAGLRSPLECEMPQWRARAEHLGVGGHPQLVALGQYLAEHEPTDARHAFLHGDPNPGNYLIEGDEVVAVVDWELAAIGDPRSDLGFYAALLTVFGGMPGDDGTTLLSTAYETATGRTLGDLAYYEALGLYKMMVVLAGWSGRSAGMGFFGMEAVSRRLSTLLGPRWAG